MTRGRGRALGLAIAIVALGGFAFMQVRERGAARERPTLMLLTSLPLMFGEDFSLEGGGSAALKALQARYRVVPISVTSRSELAKGGLLLMAQPQAQPPEDLVALDDWVRAGGRVLLLADPLLEWTSARPLGDRLRPPVMFADTGLLAHWGLRVDAPDEPGPQTALVGGHQVETMSPGRLWGSCAIGADRIVARCRVGQGRATVVADADFLDVERLGTAASHNLDGLIGELDPLE